MNIQENISLLPYNSFGIEAKADYLIEYESLEDLQALLKLEIIKSKPLLAIGQGSNLLFLSNFKGIIIHSLIKQIKVLEENTESIFIEVGSGVIWDDFVAYCVENEWYGAENLSLIPGEVGAAAVQNIGAYGVEIKELIKEVRAVEIATAKPRNFTNADCEYDYRDSIFKNRYKNSYILSSVLFELKKNPNYSLNYQNLELSVRKKGELSLHNVRETIIEIRNSKLPDPKQQGNAGSFFKNPTITQEEFSALIKEYPKLVHYPAPGGREKISAAWLIDSCGWKGKQLGRAAVHDKQALVLINKGNAEGKEIAELAEKIQNSVKKKYNIKLEPEVNFITCKYCADSKPLGTSEHS